MKTRLSKAFIRYQYASQIIIQTHVTLILLTLVTIPTGYGAYRLIDTWYQATAVLTKPPEEVKGSVVTLRLLKRNILSITTTCFQQPSAKDLSFLKLLPWATPSSGYAAELQKMKEGKMVEYVIFDNNDQNLIGAVAIRELNDIDPGQESVWINEKYWGAVESKNRSSSSPSVLSSSIRMRNTTSPTFACGTNGAISPTKRRDSRTLGIFTKMAKPPATF